MGAVEGTEAFVPAAKAAEGAAQLLELLETKFANGWLKDSPFLAGDAPTIADFRFDPPCSSRASPCVSPSASRRT